MHIILTAPDSLNKIQPLLISPCVVVSFVLDLITVSELASPNRKSGAPRISQKVMGPGNL